MKKVSIVMTYYNRQAQLLKTLESFKKYDPKDFNVVIVDDGSPEKIVLPQFPFDVKVIRITNKTWVLGCVAWNVGLSFALKDSPDIIIMQNAECYHFGDILGFAKANVTEENYITFGCYSQGKGEEPGSVIYNRGASFDGESAWYNHPVYRPKAYHFCSAISANNMRKLNGFDERFAHGIAFDDDYLLHQVATLGLKVYITTEPIVVHQWHEHASYGINENELYSLNHNILCELTKEKVFRAKHLFTEDFMKKTRFYIWVTSDCNLKCPYCSQKYTMEQNKGYQMQMEEIDYIVKSCKERGLHFDIIEITGGEASLWNNLEYGVKKFSEICDMVTLATNGNDPERIKALGLKTWIVSESQATAEQMEHYKDLRHRLTINGHAHKKPPDHPVENSLPAACCTRTSPQGDIQATFEYIRGKVYYCCDAFAHTEYVPENDEIACNFEEDFVGKFSNKDFNQEICRYCLANGKVWGQIPDNVNIENYRKAAQRK